MTDKHSKYGSGCPVAYALDIFGDRWSLLVIRDMAVKGARTYGELLNGGEGISTNILAQRMKQLEEAGILSKSKDPQNGRSYIYTLTPKGRDLAPVLADIAVWSARYNKAGHAMTGFSDKVQADRDGVITRIRAGKLP
ncbi:helix-turn-helix domain-containing protein [Leisingera sp. MMG026]|uniref:winged helix-turn-helix transcriptional regulator n=1 Tax=Leisingera sp. MMG026 TaxID=2909982 RepID=UPI001F3DF28C|nr:helix-turn-helix domain-containing protein [Leisingera sp. MMG026]MCF6433095.1 helix-turn-helix transcriptional regulator [Leisingera sp. MMG026]